MTPPAWVPIVGLLLTLSGWGKVLYDYMAAKPKVRGRIFNVMRGQMADPANPTKLLTTFVAFLYLVNQRRNTIHLLDFELEILREGQWARLKRVYGLHNSKSMEFKAPDGARIEIKNFSDNLITRKNEPVSFGKPLHGWIVFAGDDSLHKSNISEWRITCVDVYRKRHTFRTETKKFENLFLLQELADISLPQSAISKPSS